MEHKSLPTWVRSNNRPKSSSPISLLVKPNNYANLATNWITSIIWKYVVIWIVERFVWHYDMKLTWGNMLITYFEPSTRNGNGAGSGRVELYPHPYPFSKITPHAHTHTHQVLKTNTHIHIQTHTHRVLGVCGCYSGTYRK